MYPYNIRTSEDVTPVRTAPPPPPATPSLQTTPTEEGLDLSQNKDVNEILQLIIMAMTDEQRDGDFYNELSKLNKDPIDSRLLNDMFLNERRHEKMLENIYVGLTGRTPVVPPATPIPISENMVENFELAFQNELDGIQLYRTLYLALQTPTLKNIVYEILSDQQQHAMIFSYLANKYRSNQQNQQWLKSPLG